MHNYFIDFLLKLFLLLLKGFRSFLNVFSVPKRPGRTVGPCGTVFKSVPGRVSKDARAKRPNLSKTAVQGVDSRALQSLVKWVLPVFICRARPSSSGPGRHQYVAPIIDDTLFGHISGDQYGGENP